MPMNLQAFCVEGNADVIMMPITGDMKYCPECSRTYHMRSNLPVVRDGASRVYFSVELADCGMSMPRLLTVTGDLIEYVRNVQRG